MTPAKTHRLDVVSKVTIHLFAMQVVLAAVMASLSPAEFTQSFALILAGLAVIQTLFAATAAPAPVRNSLTEWDGVSWLVFLSLVFAKV